MVDFIKVLLSVFVALFPVVDPIGCAPIFLSLTQQYPESAQRILSGKIAIYSFALLVGSFLFGSIILGFFGISLVVIQIAGGLIVAATGWHLLNQKDDDFNCKQDSGDAAGRIGARLLSIDVADHRRPGIHLDRHHSWRAFETPSWPWVGAWLSCQFHRWSDRDVPAFSPRSLLLC